MHRFVLVAAALGGLAILVTTQEATAASPYLLIGLALVVAVFGYVRSRPRRPWECNDEY